MQYALKSHNSLIKDYNRTEVFAEHARYVSKPGADKKTWVGKNHIVYIKNYVLANKNIELFPTITEMAESHRTILKLNNNFIKQNLD